MSVKTKARKSALRRPQPTKVKLAEKRSVSVDTNKNAFANRRIHFALYFLLAIVTVGVYLRTLHNPFINYDDQSYVVENDQVQQGLTADTLKWALTSTDASNWHPLTWISHALDVQLFGLNPTGHHFTSILLHALNVLLLFWLLARATGNTWRSFFVAALFALHPINVESVAWVAERKNVLCTFFSLITLACYGWYARKPGAARYVALAVSFVLALAAKPMAVTLPFALLLLDFWPLRRVAELSAPANFEQRSLKLLALEKLPLLLLSGASSALTVIAQRGTIANGTGLPLLPRLVNAVYAYCMYIVKALWPAHLAAYYPYQGFRLSGWAALLCLLFLFGITVLAWRGRARTYLVVGWLWFLGTLVPVIGLVQVGDQAMADRYAYIPLIGIFCMAVWGLADLAEQRNLNLRWCGAAAGIVLAVFSFLTWKQIGTWHSSYELWTHALQVTTDNYMAEDYVGSAILVQAYEATGQRFSDEALVHFQNAVRMNPRDAISRLNLGAGLHEHGNLAEAIEQYETALQLTQDPHLVIKTLIDLGAAYHQSGDLETAKKYDREVLQLDPRNQIAFINLGKVTMDERVKELSTSAAAHPSPEIYLQLGQVQQGAGHVADARNSYQMALKLNPKFAAARSALDGIGNEVSR